MYYSPLLYVRQIFIPLSDVIAVIRKLVSLFRTVSGFKLLRPSHYLCLVLTRCVLFLCLFRFLFVSLALLPLHETLIQREINNIKVENDKAKCEQSMYQMIVGSKGRDKFALRVPQTRVVLQYGRLAR